MVKSSSQNILVQPKHSNYGQQLIIVVCLGFVYSHFVFYESSGCFICKMLFSMDIRKNF